jgi:hypothetical protein
MLLLYESVVKLDERGVDERGVGRITNWEDVDGHDNELSFTFLDIIRYARTPREPVVGGLGWDL